MKTLNIYKSLVLFENYYYSDEVYPHEFLWNENITIEQVKNAWDNFIKKNNYKNHKYLLQINIPFCETKCLYCTHDVEVKTSGIKIEKYLDMLEKEIFFYKKTFKNIEFNHLYIGGGTPSILTPEQLKRLYNMLFNNFNLTNLETNMIELFPNVVNEKIIKIIKEYGVGKVTFGIQDINEKLMKTYNRLQNKKDILKLVELLDKYNISYINVDIMAGLIGQTYNNFVNTLDFVKDLKISNICLNIFKFTNRVNYNNCGDLYTNNYYKERKKMIDYWKKEYSHRNDVILKKEIDGEQLYNFDNVNTSILGLGYGVNSHIFGNIYYKKDYLNNFMKGTNKLKGIRISIDEEIEKYIILNLKENGVSIEDINSIFGNEVNIRKYSLLFDLLIKKGLLYSFEKEGKKYFRFKFKSDLLYGLYSKIIYNQNYINKIKKKLILNKNNYINIDEKLKKYYLT